MGVYVLVYLLFAMCVSVMSVCMSFVSVHLHFCEVGVTPLTGLDEYRKIFLCFQTIAPVFFI